MFFVTFLNEKHCMSVVKMNVPSILLQLIDTNCIAQFCCKLLNYSEVFPQFHRHFTLFNGSLNYLQYVDFIEILHKTKRIFCTKLLWKSIRNNFFLLIFAFWRFAPNSLSHQNLICVCFCHSVVIPGINFLFFYFTDGFFLNSEY